MAFTFEETKIPGLLIVYPHFHGDERGSNMKTFHKDTFEEHGLKCDFGETMITTNKVKGTIRGFHYQRPPYTQSKLYYCLAGGWNNYSLDLRIGSPTYGQYICIPMNEDDMKLLYIPDGIANAHLILQDNTKVLYQMGSKYMPDFESGIRWDSVGLNLGDIHPIISSRDAKLPTFDDFESPFIYGENC